MGGHRSAPQLSTAVATSSAAAPVKVVVAGDAAD